VGVVELLHRREREHVQRAEQPRGDQSHNHAEHQGERDRLAEHSKEVRRAQRFPIRSRILHRTPNEKTHQQHAEGERPPPPKGRVEHGLENDVGAVAHPVRLPSGRIAARSS
jgi:hypothetical protein